MTHSGYGFYFEKSGRGGVQGAISPAEQFFEGSIAEVSVAREFGQNSLDNPADDDGPVRMQFELRQMSVEDIPGFDDLRSHIAAAEAATRGKSGHDRMKRALELAHESQVWVLRVGDYGTVGLVGDERTSPSEISPLVALTRGDGISANDTRAGSFGIGSAVGSMASDLCTVLYASLATDKDEVVFAGHSRLASHQGPDGDLLRADGYFTLLRETDFKYLRAPGPIGPFAERTAHGTDVFVLGYRKAAEDQGLTHIRNAFVKNFMLAIDRGKLIVEGITPEGHWVLDADTLPRHLSDAESHAFYKAMKDPEPIEAELPGLGMVRLFVEIDDSLPKQFYTVGVRSQLMKIHTFMTRSIPVKYAAVLEASNPQANEKLRKLEPPQHDMWDQGRSAAGEPNYVALLQKFVREGLRSKVQTQIGETIRIQGLDRMLPAELWDQDRAQGKAGGTPTVGESEDESSRVHGKPVAEQPRNLNAERRAVTVTIRKPASSTGEGDELEKGKDAGGSGKRRNGGQGLDGEGHEGEGRSKIHARSVAMRSWIEESTGDLLLALRPLANVHGDLTLAALAPGGAVIHDFDLPIAEATLEGADSRPIEVEGNTLRDLDLVKPTSDSGPTMIRLRLHGRHRYLLGVN